MHTYEGSCLCGAVRFQVRHALGTSDACHCRMCRKHSGHYFASADVPRSALMVQGEDRLTWYRSSALVRRGFCRVCGSSLFWDPTHRDWMSVALGAIDGPTGTQLGKHIFVADKGDYYEIADGLPQHP